MANELRQQAIKLLARREHTRVELARKLSGLGTREKIDTVLQSMSPVDQKITEQYHDNRLHPDIQAGNAIVHEPWRSSANPTFGVTQQPEDCSIEEQVLPDHETEISPPVRPKKSLATFCQ